MEIFSSIQQNLEMSDQIKSEKYLSSFEYHWNNLGHHLVPSTAEPYCIVRIDWLSERETFNQVPVSMDHSHSTPARQLSRT